MFYIFTVEKNLATIACELVWRLPVGTLTCIVDTKSCENALASQLCFKSLC